MSMEKKAFDPTVGFMFFGTWVKAIQVIKEQFGDSAALSLFSAIAEYSMYDVEPDFSERPILNAVWITIEREIDLSIGNRKRGFSKDGMNESYQAIIQAIIGNPSASLREIAAMTGMDKNMVDRVKKKYRAEIEAAVSANACNSVCDLDDACDCNTVADNDTDTVNVYDSDSVNDNDSMGRDNAGQMGQNTSLLDDSNDMPF